MEIVRTTDTQSSHQAEFWLQAAERLYITTTDVLCQAFGLEKNEVTRAGQMWAAKLLKSKGYHRTCVREGKRTIKVYARKAPRPRRDGKSAPLPIAGSVLALRQRVAELENELVVLKLISGTE